VQKQQRRPGAFLLVDEVDAVDGECVDAHRATTRRRRSESGRTRARGGMLAPWEGCELAARRQNRAIVGQTDRGD
jgi:hypothetical protein